MVVKLAVKRNNENIQIWSRYSLFKNTGCSLPASSSAALSPGFNGLARDNCKTRWYMFFFFNLCLSYLLSCLNVNWPITTWVIGKPIKASDHLLLMTSYQIFYAWPDYVSWQMPRNKQRVLMHGHQGWNVRHGLCHIYMIYVYIWVVYSFCLFCCLFIIVTTQFVALY